MLELKWSGAVWFVVSEWNGLELFLFLKILHLLVGVWDDCVCSGLPAGRANLSMFVSVLESLHQPEGLIYRPSDGQVVHRDLPEDPLVVDDEESSEGVAVLLQVDSIV